MFQFHEKNIIPYSSFDEFNNENVISGTSTSHNLMNLALHTGANTSETINNRKLFFNTFGIDHQTVSVANQIHSDIILKITEREKGRGASDHLESPDGDALITNVPDIPLLILTADCAPLLVYDRINQAIGLIHAGWKGTRAHILLKTLERMKNEYGSKAEDISIGLGPMIRSCCYKVGPEMRSHFDAEYFIQKENDLYLDLAKANREQSVSFGIPYENIIDSHSCTHCDSRFHSFRRDKTPYRIGTFMMLRKKR